MGAEIDGIISGDNWIIIGGTITDEDRQDRDRSSRNGRILGIVVNLMKCTRKTRIIMHKRPNTIGLLFL